MEALLVTGKKIGLEIIAEKIKYMLLSNEQNVGQS
jgi:hypothetical protein